jgi:hypothetical protein
VRVLHFDELEVLLPVRALLEQWCRAIADLDPAHCAIIHQPCGVHVAQVLVACNGSRAECSVVYRVAQSRATVGPDAGSHEISHQLIVKRRWIDRASFPAACAVTATTSAGTKVANGDPDSRRTAAAPSVAVPRTRIGVQRKAPTDAHHANTAHGILKTPAVTYKGSRVPGRKRLHRIADAA